MQYELFVDKLSMEEKDEFVKEAVTQAAFFGLPEESLDTNYIDFRKYNDAMWNSNLLTFTNDAETVSDFLFEPPTPGSGLLLALVRWQTALTSPPRFRKAILKREPFFFEKYILYLLIAIGRFIYRLTPTSFRYLTAYLNMLKRNGKELNFYEKMNSALSARLTNRILAVLLAPRTKEIMEKVVA